MDLHGEMVALKICDLWQHPDYEKELLNEVEVYHALKDLQGNFIPRLKGAGYTAGGLFTIATDIVGTPLEDVESLSEQERLVIQRALSSIHRYDFVHDDISRENILIERSGHQFYAFFHRFCFLKARLSARLSKGEEVIGGASRTGLILGFLRPGPTLVIYQNSFLMSN